MPVQCTQRDILKIMLAYWMLRLYGRHCIIEIPYTDLHKRNNVLWRYKGELKFWTNRSNEWKKYQKKVQIYKEENNLCDNLEYNKVLGNNFVGLSFYSGGIEMKNHAIGYLQNSARGIRYKYIGWKLLKRIVIILNTNYNFI